MEFYSFDNTPEFISPLYRPGIIFVHILSFKGLLSKKYAIIANRGKR
jgi:hypothetical protein